MKSVNYAILKAQSKDAARLTEIAFRSKALWGYDPDFMEQCRDELTVNDAFIQKNIVYCLCSNKEIAGFYSLKKLKKTEAELEHFFIDPKFKGQGFGKKLLEHAMKTVGKTGYKNLIIQSDPNAVEFYIRQGAVQIGKRNS